MCEFAPPEETAVGEFYYEGVWQLSDEYAELGTTPGSLVVHFEASKVNLVAGSDEPVDVDVLLDGELITTITITDHDLYNVVDLEGKYEQHTVELKFKSAPVRAFAFTFG